MKITDKELDQLIVEKVNRLDTIIENFSEDDKSGFVAYNGEKFYIKRANELLLKKVFSSNDITNYHEHLYTEKGSIKNSFNSNLNYKNVASTSIGSQAAFLEGFSLYNTSNRIKKIKRYDTYVLMLDTKGVFYKFDLAERKEIFAFDFVRKVTTDFAIEKLEPFDVLEFEIYKDGFLIATAYNGVFYADIVNNTIEVKFLEENVVSIKDIQNDNLLMANDEGVITIYNFTTGMRIETFNTLKKLNQHQRALESNGEYVFVLGKSTTIEENSENLLHVWKRDRAGLGYNNIDRLLYPGYDSRRYHIMFLSLDESDKHAYLSGVKDGKYLFLWKYNLEKLDEQFEEIVFKTIEIDKLNFVKVDDKNITFSNNDQLITINGEGRIIKNFYLKNLKSLDIQNVVYRKDQKDMIIVSGNDLMLYRLPDHRFEKELTFKVYDEEVACNNIDIYFSTTPIKEKITFIDADTSAEIRPYYSMNGEFGYIYKIVGSPSKKILMKVLPDETTVINGVVVNADRLFLK
jgi:hypothetical protein